MSKWSKFRNSSLIISATRFVAMASPSVHAASTYPRMNMTRILSWRLRLCERNTSIRVVAFRQIRCHRKTIKRKSRMHSPPPPPALGSCKSMGCVFYLNSRDREREDESGREGERETECDANLQFQNIPVKKGAPGGRRRRVGGLGGRRDLNPLASFSRPGAIVILIRLFVISPPLIRPNSPCFHNVSLSPFSFLSPSGRPLSSSFSLAQSQSH